MKPIARPVKAAMARVIVILGVIIIIFISPLQVGDDEADKGGHCENDNNTRYNYIRFLLSKLVSSDISIFISS